MKKYLFFATLCATLSLQCMESYFDADLSDQLTSTIEKTQKIFKKQNKQQELRSKVKNILANNSSVKIEAKKEAKQAVEQPLIEFGKRGKFEQAGVAVSFFMNRNNPDFRLKEPVKNPSLRSVSVAYNSWGLPHLFKKDIACEKAAKQYAPLLQQELLKKKLDPAYYSLVINCYHDEDENASMHFAPFFRPTLSIQFPWIQSLHADEQIIRAIMRHEIGHSINGDCMHGSLNGGLYLPTELRADLESSIDSIENAEANCNFLCDALAKTESATEYPGKIFLRRMRCKQAKKIKGMLEIEEQLKSKQQEKATLTNALWKNRKHAFVAFDPANC